MTDWEMKLLNKFFDELHGGAKVSNSDIVNAISSKELELHNLGRIMAARRGMQVVET